MSIGEHYYVDCDKRGCDRSTLPDIEPVAHIAATYAEAEKLALDAGWVVIGSGERHLCPAHAPIVPQSKDCGGKEG